MISAGTIQRVTCVLGVLAWAACAAMADELLAAISLEPMKAVDPPGLFRLEFTMVDGEPGITVHHLRDGYANLAVAEIPTGELDDTEVYFRATMSSRDVEFRACLEMWLLIGGEWYLSRAFNDCFDGTEAARPVSTPFILQKGEAVTRARFGVCFIGSGTVTLSKLELWRRGSKSIFAASFHGATGSVVSGLLSAAALSWLLIWRRYSIRDRGCVVVLRATLGFAAASGALLAIGTVAWASDAMWRAPWQPMVLLGTVGAAVFGAGYFVLQWYFESRSNATAAPESESPE